MRIVLAILLMLGWGGVASAASDGERAAVQSVIDRQIQAFLADDAATAYSFASPGIRMQFPNEEYFMEMVRRGYAPVYRPRSFTFGELTEKGAELEQLVEIVDSNGEFWTARYTLARQPDGSWKITSCHLLKRSDEVA